MLLRKWKMKYWQMGQALDKCRNPRAVEGKYTSKKRKPLLLKIFWKELFPFSYPFVPLVAQVGWETVTSFGVCKQKTEKKNM